MWLDFIWLEIWAWVKVFATRRTDTKKTVMWLANTGLEKFHGLKYLPHEALLKKYSHVVGLYMPLYVILGEKICHTRHI